MKNLNEQRVLCRIFTVLVFGLILIFGGCGGGGSDATAKADGSAITPAATPAANPSAGTPLSIAAAANSVPINVEFGPGNNINIPYVSVTLCTPGTSQCQTIDHMIVDTGSSGVRVFASKLNVSLHLPQLTIAGGALAECVQYADSSAWGPVKVADLQIGAEQLTSLAVQVLADPSFAPVPRACSNTGKISETPAAFGGNGIVGLGPFQQDCGTVCASNAGAGIYYQCVGGACQGIALPAANQIQNPAFFFASNNNGVLIVLPPIADVGTGAAQGSLIFGIGTQSNNRIEHANVLTPNAGTDGFVTEYKGRQYANSFLDSGSNGIFFTDPSIPTCESGFYCPVTPLKVSVTNRGANGLSSAVSFSITNAEALLLGGSKASDALAGPSVDPNSFDFGLSFFFGKTIFTAFEGKSTSAGIGPYFAY